MDEQKKRTGAIQKKSGKAKLVAIILLGIIVVALLSVGIYASQYNFIFPNTYVGNCEIGGKTAEEAVTLLNETYKTESLQSITIPLSCKNDQATLNTDDLEIKFLNQETVDSAIEPSKEKNIIKKTISFVNHLFSKTELEPKIGYRKDILLETMDSVAAPYEIEPVGYTFDIGEDKVTLYGKVNGIKADRDVLLADFEKQVGKMRISGLVLEPKAIEPEPIDFDEFYKWLTSEPQNASYEKGEDGKVVVKPGKLQCSVDKDTVRNALKEVDESADNMATFPVVTTKPEFTTEALEEQLYKDTLGSYTTWYSGTAARNSNVRLASSRINGIELMPGEEFSYDKTILPRNTANGYQAAPVYVGNKVESGMGGGICQPSSTLYCAALYANLEITERHNHSMQVAYIPAGMDATIAEGYLDLKFKNSTDYPIKLVADATGGRLTFSIKGYNPDNISVELVRGGGGFNYTLTRIVKKNGEIIKRENMKPSKYVPKAEEPEEEEKPEEEGTTEETPADGTVEEAPATDASAEAVPEAPADSAVPAESPETEPIPEVATPNTITE